MRFRQCDRDEGAGVEGRAVPYGIRLLFLLPPGTTVPGFHMPPPSTSLRAGSTGLGLAVGAGFCGLEGGKSFGDGGVNVQDRIQIGEIQQVAHKRAGTGIFEIRVLR